MRYRCNRGYWILVIPWSSLEGVTWTIWIVVLSQTKNVNAQMFRYRNKRTNGQSEWKYTARVKILQGSWIQVQIWPKLTGGVVKWSRICSGFSSLPCSKLTPNFMTSVLVQSSRWPEQVFVINWERNNTCMHELKANREPT